MKEKGALPGAVCLLTETAEDRVRRLYSHQGGPLIGWLWDEARHRNMELQEMAAALGVSYGYVNQLRTGVRRTSQISRDFAMACADFLGVPTVVVLLLAGALTMSDLAVRAGSDEQLVDRALRQIMADAQVRSSVPADVWSFPLVAKQALVFLYAEATGEDVFGLQALPGTVRWLQRAALQHDENQAAVGLKGPEQAVRTGYGTI